MSEWQVVSVVLSLGLVVQEWAHRRERRDLLNRLMVDKGHREYLSAEDKPRKQETRGSTIRAEGVKRSRGIEEGT